MVWPTGILKNWIVPGVLTRRYNARTVRQHRVVEVSACQKAPLSVMVWLPPVLTFLSVGLVVPVTGRQASASVEKVLVEMDFNVSTPPPGILPPILMEMF